MPRQDPTYLLDTLSEIRPEKQGVHRSYSIEAAIGVREGSDRPALKVEIACLDPSGESFAASFNHRSRRINAAHVSGRYRIQQLRNEVTSAESHIQHVITSAWPEAKQRRVIERRVSPVPNEREHTRRDWARRASELFRNHSLEHGRSRAPDGSASPALRRPQREAKSGACPSWAEHV
jgi:hypothetical protein